MRMKNYILTSTIIFLLFTQLVVINVTVVQAQTFSNPISDLADPHITYHDNHYYLTGTTGSNITIKKAATLNALKFAASNIVFTPPSGGPCCNFWAPELHRINNTWYVYYTAGTGTDLSSQRTWVIENTSSDPVAGSWTNRGQIYHPIENFWAIDGSVFQLHDKHYFIWSGYSDASSTAQRIYIAEMSSPWTLTGPRVLLSSPEYQWERNGEINEGPVVIQKNGKVFLIYSASGCWTPDYALGMLTMNESADPLNASSWVKSTQPVFVGNPSSAAYGPGHNGFFPSPDGTEFWNVYHATTIEAGACDFTRTTRAQRLEWSVDGIPLFGAPAKTGEELQAPAGEPNLPVSDALANEVYKLTSKASGKVVSVTECSADLGADVVQTGWTGADCQQWRVQATGDNYFVLTSVRGGLALDVAGCSNDNFANVQTWAPNGAYCQQWKIEAINDGYYRLLARNSNKTLTLLSGSQAEGANVVQQEWSGSDGQLWRIEKPEEIVTATINDEDAQFSVYPNPAKGAFTVTTNLSHDQIKELLLLDVHSREVCITKNHQGSNWLVNTSDLPAGIYVLRLKIVNEEFTTKIMIEK